ncbi:MAG: two-component sensor histidine kinase [Chitinophagaceae bacterium]|nr:MAG: two-component sensor histidine kinase [Chitinophagaceae bacterium]
MMRPGTDAGERHMKANKKHKRKKAHPFTDGGPAAEQAEKKVRAAELKRVINELAYQNKQKEQRAQELILANIELAYQNEQKEKRAAELAEAIKDLEAFAFVSSHHLQEPLRKIRSFVDRVLDRDAPQLSEKGRHDLERIDVATARMSQLIHDVYTYSRINVTEPVFEQVALASLIADVTGDLHDRLQEKQATVVTDISLVADVIPAQFRQAIGQLLDNALKFSRAGVPPQVFISGEMATGTDADPGGPMPVERYCCIQVKDNGIGFDPRFSETIFGIFQRLHLVEEYPGTGIGLAIVKKVMARHKGYVTADGEPGAGASFRLYLPVEQGRPPAYGATAPGYST